MSIVTLLVSISVIFISWFFYVEDRFVLKIARLRVSDMTMVVRGGDILRVGITPDGSVASHWIGNPLHHYVLLLSISNELYVAHTWYKKLTTHGNIHIPPSYQLQPLSQYQVHSNMSVVEVFRHPQILRKDFTIEQIRDVFRTIGTGVRCYTAVMNLLDMLYPELVIEYGFCSRYRLRNNSLWSFFMLKPKYFEDGIIAAGFKKSKVVLLRNLINESSTINDNTIRSWSSAV